jgi:hypothetical protein
MGSWAQAWKISLAYEPLEKTVEVRKEKMSPRDQDALAAEL